MTTIPMLERELEQAYKDIKYYKNRIEKLNNQLQQKENIIKEYAIYPGQIKINNEIFFGLDYKLTDFYNELAEENKQLKSQLQQKENIIKEVREYANTDKNCIPKHIKDYINNLLDKENK